MAASLTECERCVVTQNPRHTAAIAIATRLCKSKGSEVTSAELLQYFRRLTPYERLGRAPVLQQARIFMAVLPHSDFFVERIAARVTDLPKAWVIYGVTTMVTLL